ncbi:MAG: DUF4416 family protein [Proteobacteria bacterium]|nr:DUF4416 family protein [Pseudomonadota bacterium]
MSRLVEPTPAKLVVGVIYALQDVFEAALCRLVDCLGEVDILGARLAFDQTDYYTPEMGPGLWRRLAAFRDLIDPGTLGPIKRRTAMIEAEFSKQGRRQVNLDPGSVTLERLVLATGKNFVHRVYLGQGVYADLTLVFERGRWRPLPWTYPDYAGEELRSQLEMIRRKLKHQLSEIKRLPGEGSWPVSANALTPRE